MVLIKQLSYNLGGPTLYWWGLLTTNVHITGAEKSWKSSWRAGAGHDPLTCNASGVYIYIYMYI